MRLPWVWLPVAGPIRISTVLMSLVLIAVIVWQRRSAPVAAIAVMAWLSTYEIFYEATGVVIHGWSLGYFLWMSAAVGGWVALAVLAGMAPNRWLLLATALVWVLWIVTGFNSNSPTVAGSPGFPKDFSISGEILNELTKTLLGLAYLVGALRASKRPVHLVDWIRIR